MWTEVLQPMEVNQNYFMVAYIELFFTIFYFTFSLLQKAFVVLLIGKFIHRVGDSGSILPGEQLNQFRKLWRSMRKVKNQNSMPLKTLKTFLANLEVANYSHNSYILC